MYHPAPETVPENSVAVPLDAVFRFLYCSVPEPTAGPVLEAVEEMNTLSPSTMAKYAVNVSPTAPASKEVTEILPLESVVAVLRDAKSVIDFLDAPSANRPARSVA